ncbi:uncharacterized protein L201_003869 [Kwoniella dendrophila CBS 6074]|uniref:RRM domain-containing protein n=1 Tax=Kwoniella dendrophila CBS 6074 TaxID=1295534 RepID=A0AAX4JVL8_9TREE
MIEPMDIDLSLDEIIAKKRAEERASRRLENRPTPYKKPIPTGPRKASTSINTVKETFNSDKANNNIIKPHLKTSLSFTEIKSKYKDPSFPSFAHAPLKATPDNLKTPCREVSIGTFSRDITPAQIRDLIQSTIGPVQELRLDSKGIAWVRMLRWQGWETFTFFNGKVLDGNQRLEVRVYPLRSVPPGSQAVQNGRRGSRR